MGRGASLVLIAVGLVLSVVFWPSWGGWGWRRREVAVRDERPVVYDDVP